MSSAKLWLFGGACLLATSVASAAMAQATPGNDSGKVEEIVVTARKTGEALQRTPVAVSALSNKALATRQITQVADLQANVPGLTILGAGTGPSTIVYMAIRGQAQNSPNSATDATVGVYVDGVYLARPIVSNLGFIDIQHLEVLRGPQGTLFGRNTIGGALSVTTNQPTNRFEGMIEAGYGSYNDKRIEAVVNVPIVPDVLAARGAFQYNAHDSYYPNGNTGAAAIGSVNPDQLKYDYAGRLELKWTPANSSLKALLSFDFDDQADTGVPSMLTGANPAVVTALYGIPTGPGTPIASYLNQYNKSFGNSQTSAANQRTAFDSNKAYGISLNLDYDIGKVHLKSITGFRGSSTADSVDLDGTPYGIGAFVSYYQEHQFSQELQASTHVGKFDLIGGLYYFEETGTEESEDTLYYKTNVPPTLGNPSGVYYPDGSGLPDGPYGTILDFANFTSSSAAVFGQFNYHITDKLRFTAGLRWTWDNRGIVQHGRYDVFDAFGSGLVFGFAPDGPHGICAVGANSYSATGPCSNKLDASFNYPAYVAGFDYQMRDNIFLYANTSAADEAGSFNTRPVPAGINAEVSPEKNMAVEIGAKTEWLDHHLRANVALFTAWQTGVVEIVNTTINGQLTQYARNAGNATTSGGEVEITALPWQGMELDFSGSYLNAQYVKGTFFDTDPCATIYSPTGICKVDRSGETMPQAPKFTFDISGTQDFHIPNIGKLTVHMDYAWTDTTAVTKDTPLPVSQGNTLANVQAQVVANRLGTLPAYGLLNARVTLDLVGSKVQLALWAKNLTDTHYFTQQFDDYTATAFGTSTNYQGNPRTVGGTITYKW